MDFGRYVIQRSIAIGGMAEIFLARQRGIEGLERTVVVKRILPQFSSDEEFVTMFLDEARLMAALSHPHIAQVFDLGFADGSYYLVMEYVRGPTLGAMLGSARSGHVQLPEPVALYIARGIAEALAYVHGRHDEFGRPLEIVHRDLNPSNVIVSYDGAIKLIDFGIAKAATKVHETRTGVIKGTFGYVAPEQITLRSPVDHRADVYSLGVILYEMCTGTHPFEQNGSRDMVRRMLQGQFEAPGKLLADFPPALDRLITDCLSPSPGDRPDGVEVLARELTRVLAEQGQTVTMGDVGRMANELVPDTHGPTPLRSLRSSQLHKHVPASEVASQTVPLDGAAGEPVQTMVGKAQRLAAGYDQTTEIADVGREDPTIKEIPADLMARMVPPETSQVEVPPVDELLSEDDLDPPTRELAPPVAQVPLRGQRDERGDEEALTAPALDPRQAFARPPGPEVPVPTPRVTRQAGARDSPRRANVGSPRTGCASVGCSRRSGGVALPEQCRGRFPAVRFPCPPRRR